MMPGEGHYQEMGRPQTIESDVAVPALQAIAYGTASMLISIPVTVLVRSAPWYVPLAVFPAVSGLSYFVTSGHARGLLRSILDMYRDRESEQPEPERQVVTVKGEMPVSARKTIYTEFDVSDLGTFHAFCRDVQAGQCKFSGRAAADHGLSDEWPDILSEFVRRGLALDRGERTTPTLTPVGERMIAVFARTTPPPRED